MSDYLSRNFTVREYIRSQTATRKNIDNSPLPIHLNNARELFKHVVQPARDYFGPLIITSGYRSWALNKEVGGSVKSQHCSGEAVDIESNKVSNYDLAKWIQENTDFDQLILEFYEPGNPNSGWVHVSYSEDGRQRKQSMTASRNEKGKIVYRTGLKK